MTMVNGLEKKLPAGSVQNESGFAQAEHCAYHFARSLGGAALEGLSGLPRVVAGNLFSAAADGVNKLAVAAVQPQNERKLKKVVAAVATILESTAVGYVLGQLCVNSLSSAFDFLLNLPPQPADPRGDNILALVGAAGFAAIGAFLVSEGLTFDEVLWWLLDNRGNWNLNRTQQRMLEAVLATSGQD